MSYREVIKNNHAFNSEVTATKNIDHTTLTWSISDVVSISHTVNLTQIIQKEIIYKEQTKLWHGKQIFCWRNFLSNNASWVPLKHFRIFPWGPSLGFARVRHDLWNAISTVAVYIWNAKDVGCFSIQFSGTREPPISTQLSSFVSFL